MPLQAADEQLLADRDPPGGLFGDDGEAGDEAGEGGVPPFGVAGTARARVVQSDRVQGPFAGGRWPEVSRCSAHRRMSRDRLEEAEGSEHAAEAPDVGPEEGMEDQARSVSTARAWGEFRYAMIRYERAR